MQPPDPDALPGLPADEAGPVFREPWQAQAFALVLSLQEQGFFTWAEWAQQLNQAIDAARSRGDPDLGNTYYRHWLAALEKITTDKGLLTNESLANRKNRVQQEHRRQHEHER